MKEVGKKVFVGLSGGVDSAVVGVFRRDCCRMAILSKISTCLSHIFVQKMAENAIRQQSLECVKEKARLRAPLQC